MGRSVLVILNQLAHDPTSGAARALRATAELLALAGFEVRACVTSATESATGLDALSVLRAEGIAPDITRDESLNADVWRYTHRKIVYTALDVGPASPQSWEPTRGPAFDEIVRRALDEFAPEIVLTQGSYRGEIRRRIAARRRGAAIVFMLQNMAYLDRRAFIGVDAVITPSRFLTARYRAAIGLESTPVPPVLIEEDVIAQGGERRCLTYVNPSRPKGVMLFATLAAELSRTHPDMPILVVEARSGSGELLNAARAGGIDLAAHRNIVVSKPVARPKQFLGAARVIIAPSVGEESFGRIAAEALANGIPPVVSDRGGLPEAAAGGGFVLPLPDTLTVETDRPVPPDAVRRWTDVVLTLMTDDGAHAEASARAREAGRRYHADAIRPEILTFFARVCRLPGDTLGPFASGG